MTDEPPPKLDPDAWNRFERAVDAALHTAPKHKESKENGAGTPEPEK